MRKLTALVLALAVLTGCAQKPPQKAPEVAKDGIFVVGEDISPGAWQLIFDTWRVEPDCVWFVTPPKVPNPEPTREPTSEHFKAETTGWITIRLHEGESLVTTRQCHYWERISD